jgi:GH15 family glucan-1,4-alpha-glucosidase
MLLEMVVYLLHGFAYLTAGYKEEARKFLDFIVQMQKPNGGWAVNFFMDGSRHLWDFGDDKNEHDQVGTVPWTIYEYYLETKDVNWLRGKWSYIKKAGDFLIQFKDKNDLMTPCRDLWELHTDKSWTFTNAAAYAGLRAAYETGKILGESDIEKYQIEADKIKNAINDKLWDENGKYFVRGLRNSDNVYDKTVEAANLGLGYPFHVFDYKDEKMQMMADKIYNTLSSPKKGIRRYTNDKYYDGQPWPATTDWLAIQYAKSGNKQRAIELHNAITGYALSTESLLLGEQLMNKKIFGLVQFHLLGVLQNMY